MLKNISRAQVIGAWCAAVAVLASGSMLSGSRTLGGAALWLVACLAPPAIALLVWRGPPPATVAELLHDANAAPTEGRS
jgi:hypothetical protein